VARSRLTIAIAGALLLATVIASIFALRANPTNDPDAASVAVVSVVRRDLVTRASYAGSLGYADTRPVVSRRAGTITALPREGSILRRGDIVYRVDRTPVALLYGAFPAWRALAPGVSPGPDVRQLEQNLNALGFGRQAGVVADSTYDETTRVAVAAWQRSLGVSATGLLALGSILFLPGPRHVGTVRAVLGIPTQAGETVLNSSSLVREARINLPANEQDLARRGRTVGVALPTGRSVSGRVTDVGKVAIARAGEAPSITVRISVGGSAVSALDQAPIRVSIEVERKRAAIAVPIQALLAVQGGGYAVELIRDGGEARLVPVELGAFADGYVEVVGTGIRPGVRVTSAE
jgi:peptidoglycan hydrolase-like protein with peptidoglycan-binding domain